MADDMASQVCVLGSVDEALRVTRQRLDAFPKHGIYRHALEQLQTMKEWLQGQRDLREFAGSIDLGLMATKELESSDMELADALMLADFQFKKLAGIA